MAGDAPPPGYGPQGRGYPPPGYGYPVPHGPPIRAPHPHPGLRVLGIVHLIASGLGALGWFAGYYVAAFCGDGVENAPRCDHVRSVTWQPATATVVSGLVALIVVLRTRRADARVERAILAVASVVSAVVMVTVVIWFFDLANSSAPPA